MQHNVYSNPLIGIRHAPQIAEPTAAGGGRGELKKKKSKRNSKEGKLSTRYVYHITMMRELQQ